MGELLFGPRWVCSTHACCAYALCRSVRACLRPSGCYVVERPKSHSYIGFYPSAKDIWQRASHQQTWEHGSGRVSRTKPEALQGVLDWVWRTHAALTGDTQATVDAQRQAAENAHRAEHGDEFLGSKAEADPSQGSQAKRRRTG